MMELAEQIARADARLRGVVRETPLVVSDALSATMGATVLLKLENLQITGSFKYRGARHKMLCLTDDERRRGIVAASSGNHGAAVARACHDAGVACTVFVPEGASPVKVDAMRRMGASVEFHGTDGLDTELRARSVAEESGRPYVSPYNDADIVAGQGTVAAEVRRQTNRLDAVIVAVGGGGLIGGMATDLKAHLPHVRVIGALPEASPAMERSVAAGRIVEVESEPTLSDGTAGGIEPGAMTFDICRRLVDEWVLVPEDEIAAAIRHALSIEHLLIEGAAGVAIAGALRMADSLRDARVAVVLCGANISPETLRKIL